MNAEAKSPYDLKSWQLVKDAPQQIKHFQKNASVTNDHEKNESLPTIPEEDESNSESEFKENGSQDDGKFTMDGLPSSAPLAEQEDFDLYESDNKSDMDSAEDSQNQEGVAERDVQTINTANLENFSGEGVPYIDDQDGKDLNQNNEEDELSDGVSTDSRHPEDGSKNEEKPSENESEASSLTLVGSVLSNSRTLTPETLDDRKNDFDGENVDETNAQDTFDDFESGGSERVSNVNDDHQRESRTIDAPASGDNGDSDNTGGNGDSDANDQSLTNDDYSESFGSMFGDAAENTSTNEDVSSESNEYEPGATDVPCAPEGCLNTF